MISLFLPLLWWLLWLILGGEWYVGMAVLALWAALSPGRGWRGKTDRFAHLDGRVIASEALPQKPGSGFWASHRWGWVTLGTLLTLQMWQGPQRPSVLELVEKELFPAAENGQDKTPSNAKGSSEIDAQSWQDLSLTSALEPSEDGKGGSQRSTLFTQWSRQRPTTQP